MLLFTIVIVVQQIAKPFESWVDSFFDVTRYRLVADEDADNNIDTQYYKSDYAIKDENGNLVLKEDGNGVKLQTFDNKAMREHSLDVAERVGEEGSVLLWNNNSALPLKEGDKVSTFGVTSLDWLYGGTGSGFITVTPTDLQQVLESRNLSVNKSMINLLKRARVGYGRGWGQYSGNLEGYLCSATYYTVGEIPWKVLNTATSSTVEKTVGEYGDAAIYTVTRNGGEGALLREYFNESEDGSYLSFTRDECSVLAGLQQLKESGKIKKIILVINSPGAMSMKYAADYDIDACLWVGLGGNASMYYLADLLVGNANPSGHLTDTWVYDIASAPANENFGNYTFAQSTGLPAIHSGGGSHNNDKYVVYQEGIYVGYLYYETRYEDLVIGGRNAESNVGVKAGGGSWDYGKEVAYTFGHGESYTDFEYSNYSVKKNGDDYVVSMTITNKGSVAGKEVMQVYLQKPYTDYDVKNNVEKAAVELVGFAKTKLLQPDEKQTLTVTVPEYEFKSYDSYGAGTYILEKGSYYLAAGKDAHDALNNILAEKGYSKADGMDADGDKSFAEEIKYSKDDFESYSISPFTGEKIENRFNDVDVNLYDGTTQKVTYLSRSNWKDTYPTGAVLNCTEEKMIADMQYARPIIEDPEAVMPVYDTVTSEYGKLSLIQLMGIPYDDPLWQDLLNQMTFEEQVNMVARGSHKIAGATSVNAPGYKATDGPCGIIKGSLAEVGEKMEFPCNGIVASTFNVELVEELGNAFGMEIMHVGYTGIYGTGVNIHRSAYGGRTWEYFSEDGFLTGKIYTALSRGLMNKGVVLFTKHLVLNEQECNRGGVTTWANEQSVREIYLKAFEAGITEGKTNGIMSSFNRIGCTWTGAHRGLLTGILRTEWGFNGIVESDSPSDPHMSGNSTIYAAGIIAGQDVWMGNMDVSALDEYKDNATLCQALRESTHRNLYVQLNSSAMNGISSATHVEYIIPAWEKTLLAVEIITGVFAGACIIMVAVSWVFWDRNGRKNININKN